MKTTAVDAPFHRSAVGSPFRGGDLSGARSFSAMPSLNVAHAAPKTAQNDFCMFPSELQGFSRIVEVYGARHFLIAPL